MPGTPPLPAAAFPAAAGWPELPAVVMTAAAPLPAASMLGAPIPPRAAFVAGAAAPPTMDTPIIVVDVDVDMEVDGAVVVDGVGSGPDVAPEHPRTNPKPTAALRRPKAEKTIGINHPCSGVNDQSRVKATRASASAPAHGRLNPASAPKSNTNPARPDPTSTAITHAGPATPAARASPAKTATPRWPVPARRPG